MANLPIPDEQTWILYESYTGTGPLNFTFSIFAKADLTVYVDGVVLEQTDFTFSGTHVDSGYDGGAVTLVDAVADAEVIISRNVATVRTTDFYPANQVPIIDIDAALDRLTAMNQDARRDVNRSLRVPLGDTPADLELPGADDRANRVLGFNADGDVTTYAQGGGGGGGGGGDYVARTGDTMTGALTLPANGLRFGGDTALYRGSGVLNAVSYDGLTYRRVAGADPVNANDFVTKGWGMANLAGGGGAVPTGFDDLTPVNGSVDLSANTGKIIRLHAPVSSDFNVWEFTGGVPGRVYKIKPQLNMAFLIIPPPFYVGSCVLKGNYQAAAQGHDALAGEIYDTFDVLCLDANTYEVMRVSDGLDSRVDWQDSSHRQPLETYRAIGKPGKFTSTRGLPWFDLGIWQNGTVGKPITTGWNTRGRGDSAAGFMETYDIDSDGFLVMWSDRNKIGNHLTLRSAHDNGSGLLIYSTVPPAGWTTGPGSLLQPFLCRLDYYAYAIPTAGSTPGGMTMRATRPGTTTDIDVVNASHDGSFWVYGKAALEGGATGAGDAAHALSTLAAGLSLSNVENWHQPSLLLGRYTAGVAALNVPSTPSEMGGALQNFGTIAMRRATDLGKGQDFFYRSDDDIEWVGSVTGGSRSRGFGTRPGCRGTFIGGDNAADWHQVQTARYQLANNGTATFPLRTGQFGWIRIVLEDATYADFGISQASGIVRLGYTTDATKFSNTNGTASKVNVDVVGGNLRVENKLGGIFSFYQTTLH